MQSPLILRGTSRRCFNLIVSAVTTTPNGAAAKELGRAPRNPEAYEQAVDRWLDSLHFGERWARHWLELAHYGDPHGFERGKLRDNTWHRMKKAMIGDHIEALRNATGLPRGSLRLLLNKEGEQRHSPLPFSFAATPRKKTEVGWGRSLVAATVTIHGTSPWHFVRR